MRDRAMSASRMEQIPKRIFNPDPTTLAIEWPDGTQGQTPFRQLRFECTCAFCQDEHTGEKKITLGQIKPDIRPLRIAPVGRYAIQIVWSDQHQSGLYTYQRLRTLVR